MFPSDETAETMLAKTLFLVEATSNETHSIWCNFASDSNERIDKKYSLKWENYYGWLVQVGELDDMPVCISLMWYKLDGNWVCFWHPTSVVVDYRQILDWLAKNFTGTWSGGRATCNSSNFHRCLHALDERKAI